MNMLKKLTLAGAAALLTTFVCAGETIDQFTSLDTSEGYFWGDDMIYYYTNFTIIQDYESDERLSLKSLSPGDWLVISYQSDNMGRMTAKQILIVPDEETARSVKRAM